MRLTFLGTGTSVGVPTIGCECDTCLSIDPRDRRLRASVLIEHGGRNILIDASTDFRFQALRAGLTRVDAVLFTHAHADHCFGLDDMRPIMARHGSVPCYASELTWKELQRVYSYIFDPTPYSSVPRIAINNIDGPFELFGLGIEPLTVMHGRMPVTAFRIGRFAYLTDCNLVPDETCGRLGELDLLVIDALRFKQHPTHLTVDEALGYIERVKPERALLTHISHDIRHAVTSESLPPGVGLAYDGLQAEID